MLKLVYALMLPIYPSTWFRRSRYPMFTTLILFILQASKAVAWEQTTGKHMVRMWRTLTMDGGFPCPHLQAVIPHKQHLNCRYTSGAEPEKCIVVEQQSDVIVYCCSLISVCVCVCVVGGINLIAVLTLIVIFIHYWLQYGKGLKEYCEYSVPG